MKKVLIHSNSPTAATGYGVQTRHLCEQLADAGYDVAVSCTWGHQGQIGSWRTRNGHQIRLYPTGYELQSLDLLIGHAEHFFEGDPTAGVIVLLLDVWVMNKPLLKDTLAGFNVVAWTPVDHDPAPPQVLEAITGMGARAVAMTRFGQDRIQRAGIDCGYVPLSVDTHAYQPTFSYRVGDDTLDSRSLFDLPLDAFVVGMVAMNKDGLNDRKGFDEAFQAFARFWRDHQNAVLFVHTEKHGLAGGADLPRMAAYAGIPPHAIVYTDQYMYRMGMPPDMMAAAYTAMDVLLAPSRGEGFCVPMIEAQACGTPVIVSDFAAQTELVGNGWLVIGQKTFDIAQSSYYQTAFVSHVVEQLNAAYTELEERADEIGEECVAFAAGYDTEHVFDEFWRAELALLEPPAEVEKPVMDHVDVIVPLMRPENLERLALSVNEDRARIVVVHDNDNPPNLTALPLWKTIATGEPRTGYAEKVNLAVEESVADWVLIVGDDVEFTDGWFDAAVDHTRWADVVGTNDSEDGRIRNQFVAAGNHADHFFIRRQYIDNEGASLDGPGAAMPTAYGHWFVDKEVIGLAQARGVYRHAHECRIIHHHPGYDADTEAIEADPTYAAAIETSDADLETWTNRRPLIAMHQR